MLTRHIPGTSIIFLLVLLQNTVVYCQRPNIIYIMTDDMGYADLSGYGRKDYQTPNLDKLASQGIKFLNAYSAGPLCTPTRTALMTGRYPARTPVGLMEPLTAVKRDSAYGLTSEYPSVASFLKSGGYETALVGKWHLGFMPEHSPNRNGFDYFFGIHSGAADYISHKNEARRNDLYENDKLVYPEGYLTDLIAQKAVWYIKKEHVKPFFLAITFNAPHWPWQGPADKSYPDTTPLRAGGTKAVYASMIKSLDDGVGEIMKAIDEKHLSNNTILIFTNDNGGERFSDNGPFSNGTGTLWEGGIRVPAFVRWPGKIHAGQVTKQAAITMDWTVVMLSVARVKSKKLSLDGIDLLPIMMGKKNIVERTFFWRTTQRTQHKACRDGRWKYLKDEKGEWLFDLDQDPGEKHDLKENNKAIFNRIKAKYENWEKKMLSPIPLVQH